MTTDNHDQALEARARQFFLSEYKRTHECNPRCNFDEAQVGVAIRAIVAGLREARVPDGQALVPVEPTEAMARVFRADMGSATQFTHTTVQCADFASRYRAMIAAATQRQQESPNG